MSLDKFKGCLLAAALGDALGASRGRIGRVLRYTDDTAMMLALAESIIERGRVDPLHLAYKFAEEYRKEPWRGYGPGPPRIFRMIERGLGPLELDKRLYPGGSFGNGCAMRIAPLGLLHHRDPKALRKAVEDSCKPTHNHPLGVEGALLEAAAVSLAVEAPVDEKVEPESFVDRLSTFMDSEIYLEKLDEVLRLLRRKVELRAVARRLGNTVEAFNSVPTAIYIYLRAQDPLETIKLAIKLGGDTDTIACMAGAVAGAHRGIGSMPRELLEKIENRDRIEGVAEGLWRLVED